MDRNDSVWFIFQTVSVQCRYTDICMYIYIYIHSTCTVCTSKYFQTQNYSCHLDQIPLLFGLDLIRALQPGQPRFRICDLSS